MINGNKCVVWKQDRHRWQNQIDFRNGGDHFYAFERNPHFQPPKPPTWPGRWPKKHTAKEIVGVVAVTTTREAVWVSRTAWEVLQGTCCSCPSCGIQSPSIKSAEMHWDEVSEATLQARGLVRHARDTRWGDHAGVAVCVVGRISMSSRRVSPGSKS